MGDSSETKEKVLQSAIKIFGEKGYNGTTTKEIAMDAGVAEGTVFKYYKTKKDLLDACLHKIVNEILPSIVYQPVFGIVISKSDDILGTIKNLSKLHSPKDIMHKFIKDRINLVNKNINAARILLTEIQYHEDLKNAYIKMTLQPNLDFFSSAFKLGVSLGIFKDINPLTAIRSLLGMVVSLVIETNVFGRKPDLDNELNEILEIYFNGILKK